MATVIPTKGDPYTVTRNPGYKLVQDRPFDCRPVCECGKCNGVQVEYKGTVEAVVYYADNSTEVEVRCEDGELRRVMLVAPHGDVC